MENLVINIGNPRRVELAVLSANGVKVELSRCTDVQLILWINGRSKRALSTQISNDVLIADLSASELSYLGEYSGQVKYTDDGVQQTTERVYLFRVANEFFKSTSGTGVSDTGSLVVSVSTPIIAYDQKLVADAEKATADANAAKDLANTAATNANDKANLANTAARNADIAKANAEKATADANTATLNASNAATNANDKAAYAKEQGDYAKQQGLNAVSTAGEAATNADNAAFAASQQAAYAKQQGDYAKQEAQGIDAKIATKADKSDLVQLEQEVSLKPSFKDVDISNEAFESGTLDQYGAEITSESRIRSNYIVVNPNFKLIINADYLFNVYYYIKTSSGYDMIKQTGWVNNLSDNVSRPDAIRIIIKKSDNSIIDTSHLILSGITFYTIGNSESLYSSEYSKSIINDIISAIDTGRNELNYAIKNDTYVNFYGYIINYQGSSKWSSVSVDISNIEGIISSNFNCDNTYDAKSMIINSLGDKRFISNKGDMIDVIIYDTDVSLLISHNHTNTDIGDLYVGSKISKKIDKLENLLDKRLSGKRLSIIGDSISTFSPVSNSNWSPRYPSGDITSQDHTYWGMLVKNDGMILDTVSAWGGSMIAKELSDGQIDISMCDDRRLTNLGNPDVILLFGGTNDFGYKNRWRQLGDFDFGNKTPDLFKFKTAIQYTIEKLQRSYPSAQLFIMTPLQRARYKEYNADYPTLCDYPATNGLGLRQYQYRDALVDAANIYGVPIIDTNKCGITYYNSNNNTDSGGINKYTQDGVHPNRAGMELIYNIVKRSIVNIIK